MIKQAKHILGVFLGLLLFFLWIFLLFVIATSFLAEAETIHSTEIVRINTSNQIFIWIMAGPLPFFIILGHYFISGEQKDLKQLKFSLIGFSIWLIALIIALLAGINLSPKAAIGGGYIVMFLALLFEKLGHNVVKDSAQKPR